MEPSLATLCLGLMLAQAAPAPVQEASVQQLVADSTKQAAPDSAKTGAVKAEAAKDEPYVHNYEFVPEGEFDPASVPVENGIVWYGTWEAAMAEKERTGKPVMLHMGSPRCPAESGHRVPGTW